MEVIKTSRTEHRGLVIEMTGEKFVGDSIGGDVPMDSHANSTIGALSVLNLDMGPRIVTDSGQRKETTKMTHTEETHQTGKNMRKRTGNKNKKNFNNC